MAKLGPTNHSNKLGKSRTPIEHKEYATSEINYPELYERKQKQTLALFTLYLD